MTEEILPLSAVSLETFSPHVSTVFTLHWEGEECPLTLEDASAARGGSPAKRQPFSLLFTGTPGRVFPQHIYPLTHPVLGRIEIFLVPVGASSEGTQYEAIFA